MFLKFSWIKYVVYRNLTFINRGVFFICAFSFYALVFSLKVMEVLPLYCLITGHCDSKFRFLTLNSAKLQMQQTEAVMNKNVPTYSYKSECVSQPLCE